MAWVLGAVLAPTDATAVAAIAGRLPRRQATLVRAESLINDGTALAVYGVAVGVAVGTLHVGAGGVAWRLAWSYAGGIAVGLAVAGLVVLVRRRMTDVRLGNLVGQLTPFVAYLPAELLGASGVVAVVTTGLALTQVPPTLIPARARVQSRAFGDLTSYVLNGALFVLIGLQLHAVVAGLPAGRLATGALAALVVSLVVVGTRLVWTNTTPYLIRALDRRPAQRQRRVGFRQRQPLAWAGFRGAVSLAAALAVPAAAAGGGPLAGRDLVLLITFGVIVFTLVVQGLTLPAVVRWAQLPQDARETEEQRLAQREATRAALAAVEDRAAELDVPDDVWKQVRAGYEEHLRELELKFVVLDGGGEDRDRDSLAALKAERRLRLALLADKRQALARLRHDHRIDDLVLVRMQNQLDAEEVRLSGVPDDE
jgi:CPA1 family monovalent cation:H+ antiporter